MTTALYRRYRPQTFDEVVNQRHVVQTLVNELEHDRLAHAYLFCGPRGVGKTTVARLLAKAANSPKRLAGKKDWPALDDLPDRFSLDVIEIDAASHTQVDHVREHIIPTAYTVPTISRYKVFIIDEVHMLSVSAFNALLKILEEPPQTVIFILATTEVHRVPPTIISRCQRFDFHKLKVPDLIDRLQTIAKKEKVEVEEGVLRTIAVLAEGSARDAEGMLGQVLSLGEKKITSALAAAVLPRTDSQALRRLFSALAERDIKAALLELNKASEEGVVMSRFAKEWLELLRQVLLARLGTLAWEDITFTDGEESSPIKQLTEKLSAQDLLHAITVCQKHLRNLALFELEHLPLELAFVELIGENDPHDGSSPRLTAAPAVSSTSEKSEVSLSPAPVSKKTKAKVHAKAVIAKSAVDAVWPDIIKAISTSNHSLGMVLKSGIVHSVVDGNTVILGFGYKLHAERVQTPVSREIVAKALEAALKKPVVLKTIVNQSLQKGDVADPSDSETAELQDMVMKTFGGDLKAG